MAGKCDNCGKASGFGNNVSHSKRRTSRQWGANIQKTKVMVDGQPRAAFLCTRCMRTQAKKSA